VALGRGLLATILLAGGGCGLLPAPPVEAESGDGEATPSTASPLGGTAARRPVGDARFLTGRYDLRAYGLEPGLLQLGLGRSGVWALNRVSLTRGEAPLPLAREGPVAFGRGAEESRFPAGFCPADTPFVVDLASFLRQLHEERGLSLPPGTYTVLVEGRFTPLEDWPPEPRELAAGDRFETSLRLRL
jgi:hypothetical protein